MAMPSPVPSDAPECQVSDASLGAMLSANYEAFDQSMTDGRSWRPIMNKGCYDTAAFIILKYLNRNPELTAEERRTLNFHAGQVLALGGKDAASVAYFDEARGGDAEWNAYVEATLAFLTKDRRRFDASRAEYLRVAPGSPRQSVLDALSACFQESYAAAVACP